ncbi:hypothetical protein EGT07_26895 [Herbaspirillum sp. HC18]|nr:hypothetical protein EGT07_26895 [Herbaspirillum sp. HC18]
MILFLDFDGVLHPVDRRSGILSCLSELEAVLLEFRNIEIVISSSWRTEYSLVQLRAMFSPDIAPRIIDVTPDRATAMEIIEPYRREREIEDWLRENDGEHEPWFVLDDCEWMFSPACTRLLRMNPATGFTAADAAMLRHHLSRL